MPAYRNPLLRRVTGNAFWSFVGVAGGPMAGMLVAIVALRVADAAAYGVYSLALSFVITGSVAGTLGVSQKVIPWLGGRPPGQASREAMARIQVGLLGPGVVAGLVVVGLLLALQAFGLLATFPDRLLSIVLVGVVAQGTLSFGREAARGVGRLRTATLLSSASISTLTLVALLVASAAHLELDGVSLTTLSVALSLLLAVISATAVLRGTSSWKQASDVLADMKAWIRSSYSYAMNSLLATVHAGTGLWIVAALSAHGATVGQFALATKLALIFTLPLATVEFGMARHMAEHAQLPSGPKPAPARMALPLRLSSLIVGGGMLITALFGDPILTAVFGPDGGVASPLVLVLAAGVLAATLAGPAHVMLQYSGYERLVVRVSIGAVLISGLGGLLGMRLWGPVGVVVASSVATVASSSMNTWAMRNRLGWTFLGAVAGRRLRGR